MKRLPLLLLLSLIVACANPSRIPINSADPSAGQVVVSIGAATGTNYSGYSLLFRRTGSTDPEAFGGFSYPFADSVPRRTADYKSTQERGAVVVASLPAGSYEIYDFDIFLNTGTVQKNFSSKKLFAIPFTVKPGQVTYLGNYQANGIRGENLLGVAIAAGAVFVVADRQATDLQLARTLTVPLGTVVENQTPSAASLPAPFFVAATSGK